jgi:hypothetical protein
MIGEIATWILISDMLIAAAGMFIGFLVMTYNLLTEI